MTFTEFCLTAAACGKVEDELKTLDTLITRVDGLIDELEKTDRLTGSTKEFLYSIKNQYAKQKLENRIKLNKLNIKLDEFKLAQMVKED